MPDTPHLLALSLSADKVADLFRQAAWGELGDIAVLHKAIVDCETMIDGYLGRASLPSLVRANSDNYADPLVREAFERFAQMVERRD